MDNINAIGRRKAAIARVYLREGSGSIKINGRTVEDYFPQKHIAFKVHQPMQTVEVSNLYDVLVNVKGGGLKGQAEAIRMGIARALTKVNEDFRSPLKQEKFLTRDARVVERKKYGKPKARKSFQFSKR